jgi:hypothetical protein
MKTYKLFGICPCDKCPEEHPGCICDKAISWYKVNREELKRQSK